MNKSINTSKKSIIIDASAHKELTKLSEVLKMNYGNLIEEMIYFFKKTGIDPKDAVNKNPSEMVSALDKRIVSFLKVQERDILKPLRQDVFNYQNLQKEETSKLIASLNRLINQNTEKLNDSKNNYIEMINKIEKNDVIRSNLFISETRKNYQAMLIICQLIDDKNRSGAIDKIKAIFT